MLFPNMRLAAAWLRYMQERPMTASGYIDNPHGNWLRGVTERVHSEEVRVRQDALDGSLTPPRRD